MKLYSAREVLNKEDVQMKCRVCMQMSFSVYVCAREWEGKPTEKKVEFVKCTSKRCVRCAVDCER